MINKLLKYLMPKVYEEDYLHRIYVSSYKAALSANIIVSLLTLAYSFLIEKTNIFSWLIALTILISFVAAVGTVVAKFSYIALEKVNILSTRKLFYTYLEITSNCGILLTIIIGIDVFFYMLGDSQSFNESYSALLFSVIFLSILNSRIAVHFAQLLSKCIIIFPRKNK